MSTARSSREDTPARQVTEGEETDLMARAPLEPARTHPLIGTSGRRRPSLCRNPAGSSDAPHPPQPLCPRRLPPFFRLSCFRWPRLVGQG